MVKWRESVTQAVLVVLLLTVFGAGRAVEKLTIPGLERAQRINAKRVAETRQTFSELHAWDVSGDSGNVSGDSLIRYSEWFYVGDELKNGGVQAVFNVGLSPYTYHPDSLDTLCYLRIDYQFGNGDKIETGVNMAMLPFDTWDTMFDYDDTLSTAYRGTAVFETVDGGKLSLSDSLYFGDEKQVTHVRFRTIWPDSSLVETKGLTKGVYNGRRAHIVAVVTAQD